MTKKFIMKSVLPLAVSAVMLGSAAPAAYASAGTEAAGSVEAMLSSMTLDDKISQMIMPAIRNWDDKGVTELSACPELEEALCAHQYGGIILYGSNVKEAAQVTTLVRDLQVNNLKNADTSVHVPYFMAADQEGGIVVRLNGGTRMTGSMAIGATGENAAANAEKTGRVIGEEMAAAGFNVDFAPDIDVNNNAANPVIGTRSFSDDPDTVAALGTAWNKGLAECGVIGTYKHFPGHGDTAVDSHIGTPSVEKDYDQLKEVELVPFARAVEDGADMIMTAHITFPLLDDEMVFGDGVTKGFYPATMSKKIITGILRDDLGYDGVVVTDALEMDAIRKAGLVPGAQDSVEYHVNIAQKVIDAGIDLLLLPRDMNSPDAVLFYDQYIKGLMAMVEDGTIPMERIDESVTRILKLKEKYGILDPDKYAGTEEAAVSHACEVIGSAEHHAVELEIAEQAITLLKNDSEALPFTPYDKKIVFLGRQAEDAYTISFALNQLKEQGFLGEDVAIHNLAQGTRTGAEDADTEITIDYYFNPSSKESKLHYTEDLQKAIREADVVVGLTKTFNLGALEEGSEQYQGIARAIRDAHGAGSRFVLLSNNLPYDAARYQDADAILLAYMGSGLDMDPTERYQSSGNVGSYNANVVTAIHMMFGDGNPSGKLPVQIPEITTLEGGKLAYSDKVLYKRGYGLSYSGSESVGQLKILARFDDSMQPYDGHVYLLFTSYKDGVEIKVEDLYRGYEISGQYYEDMEKDISSGSNHTGSDADKYFTLRDDMTSVTLDRGQIVTIGMHRGFDLSMQQAILGALANSTVAKMPAEDKNIVKTATVTALFDYLHHGKLPAIPTAADLLNYLTAEGLEPAFMMDGTVEGGVCFNRELYTQKLGDDQYENVTFALDINQAQLNRMMKALQGNLNKFSIAKNNSATVALRGWNAAVGLDADGGKTEYYLSPSGTGISAVFDMPKTVRDEVGSLSGSWLNNSSGVQEPGAGYQDDTGWVYVSGPGNTLQKAAQAAAYAIVHIKETPAGGPVGRLTISSRPVTAAEPVPHGILTFTPYGDIDLNVSYYGYQKPTEEYKKLMEDYADHPEHYASDPAIFSEELDPGKREGCFEPKHNGAFSSPEPIHLDAGESITLSTCSFDESHLTTLMGMLEHGRIIANPAAQGLVRQMHIYVDGGTVDGPFAYDCMAATLGQVMIEYMAGGSIPADGYSEGGLMVNQDVYDQFVGNDIQLPNCYYTVEITAEELASLMSCLADPGKNFFGLLSKNFASGAVDIWNTVLSDRPDLALSGNYSKVTMPPQSLYYELGMLSGKTGKVFDGTGEGGGTDWIPRVAPGFKRGLDVTPPKALPLVYNGEEQELVEAGSAEGATVYYALGEDGLTAPEDGLFTVDIPKAADAGTYYVWYKAVSDIDQSIVSEPGCVTVEISGNAYTFLLDEDGIWRVYRDGEFQKDYMGLLPYDGSVFFIANGVLCSDASGLNQNVVDGKWYFLADGQVQVQHSGFAEYDSNWFMIVDGKLDEEANGLYAYDGGIFAFAAGKLRRDIDGLWQNPVDQKWYFLAGGQVQEQHTGVAEYDGAFFVVEDGKLVEDFNGVVEYDSHFFKVENGQLAEEVVPDTDSGAEPVVEMPVWERLSDSPSGADSQTEDAGMATGEYAAVTDTDADPGLMDTTDGNMDGPESGAEEPLDEGFPGYDGMPSDVAGDYADYADYGDYADADCSLG